MDITLLDEVQLVHKILVHTNDYGLQAEVVTSAFKYMQDHPGCSVSEALHNGLLAWDL
jgi:hypothetical protein